MLRVGDEVMYRPGWGSGSLTQVRIESMEYTEEPRGKYGHSIDLASWDAIAANHVMFDLDNGHWSYSDQIDIEETKKLNKNTP